MQSTSLFTNAESSQTGCPEVVNGSSVYVPYDVDTLPFLLPSDAFGCRQYSMSDLPPRGLRVFNTPELCAGAVVMACAQGTLTQTVQLAVETLVTQLIQIISFSREE